jgi:hypothetical protein
MSRGCSGITIGLDRVRMDGERREAMTTCVVVGSGSDSDLSSGLAVWDRTAPRVCRSQSLEVAFLTDSLNLTPPIESSRI